MGPARTEAARAASTTLTVTAVADTFVSEASPSFVGGDAPRLLVDGSPRRQAFVRFDVPELDGTLTQATLRLHVADLPGAGSTSGGTVAGSTDVTWPEARTTWDDRPAVDRPGVGRIGPVGRDRWVSRGVTALVESGQSLTVVITSAAADDVAYDARGSGAGPRLLLEAELPEPDGIMVDAVGDMVCGPGAQVTVAECHHLAVSDLVAQDPDVAAFLALGDLQYNGGALASFQSEYEPSYGRVKAITHPAGGNHEYGTPDAAGYFEYFGAAAGTPGDGWYSFDLGPSWHLVALNSNCEEVSCVPGSPQVEWLRADLDATDRPCVLAYWHHPRYSSGPGNNGAVAPFLWALQQHRAEIVLNGHAHQYERFARQHPDGTTAANGFRPFVVGTGGRSYGEFHGVRPGSQVRIERTFGVLQLTLRPASYEWSFVGEDGQVRDSGSDPCH